MGFPFIRQIFAANNRGFPILASTLAKWVYLAETLSKSLKMYLQNTSSECGLCCVAYVAAKYGSPNNMRELREKFAISQRGASLSQIIDIASALGLSARALRADLDELNAVAKFSMLHWDLNNFVVLINVRGKKVTIFDPASGVVTLSKDQVSRRFTGVVVEFLPAENFVLKKASDKVPLRSLIGKVLGLKRSLIQIGAVAACLQVLSLIMPMAMQWVVDGAIVSGDKGFLIVLCIGFIMVAVSRVILEAARTWLAVVLAFHFQIQWAGKILGHLLKLPLSWFEPRHIGDIVSRFDSMKSIQQTLTGKLTELILDAGFGFTVLVVMLLYSPLLTVIAAAGLAVYAVIRILPHAKFHQINDEVLISEAKAQSHFLESIRAVQAVKLSRLEDGRRARWLNLLVDAANKRVVSQKMSIGFTAGYGFIFTLESVVVLGLGSAMVIDGDLTVGMLIAFIAYKDDFSSRMQRVVDNSMALKMLSLHAERVADIVLTDTEKLDFDLAAPSAPCEGSYSIEFKNVSFKYGAEAPWAVRQLSFSILPGEHVAIVGASGSGKTTLVKILLGLLSPTEGCILINGEPMHKFGLSKWRKSLGAVMQNDLLFSGSLQENICRFSEVVDLEQMRKVSGLAAIHEDIMKMPMGYRTMVGDMGSGMSGGQTQRVLLARALYTSPVILILDEATSHLDLESEERVNRSVSALNITRIVIAHRPDTIAMAGRIIDLSV